MQPGIPRPQDLVQPERVNGSKYYVVFAGTRIGIFANWYGCDTSLTGKTNHALGTVKSNYTLTVFLGPIRGAITTGMMLERLTMRHTSATPMRLV